MLLVVMSLFSDDAARSESARRLGGVGAVPGVAAFEGLRCAEGAVVAEVGGERVGHRVGQDVDGFRAVADGPAGVVEVEDQDGERRSVASRVGELEARGMLEPVPLPDGSTVRMSRLVPLLSRTPARSHFAGPELGAHNEEIWGERLGLGPQELADLRATGVI